MSCIPIDIGTSCHPRSGPERPPDGSGSSGHAGRAKYKFVAVNWAYVVPDTQLADIKVPDSTPSLIAHHALNDEQSLLALLRYNRLLDIFSGAACYSLQNHLRTQVEDMGQVETDELYLGVDTRGAQFVFPVQAKGGNDKLSVVQIGQDVAMCKEKFPTLLCRPIAAQFLPNRRIAIFEFRSALRPTENVIEKVSERHYELVPAGAITDDELAAYRKAPTE